MLTNRDIICISSIDWDFVWQGHQEIMSTFAKNGNHVLFIENTGIRTPNLKDFRRLKKRIINWFKSTKGFKQVAENLYVYSPIILPFPYSRIACWINRFFLIAPLKRWMKAVEFHSPIIWTFLPTGTALDIINSIDRELLIYYCIADFYELAGSPKKVRKTENELIRTSDLIFAQGNILKEKCKQLNDNVYIFPFGVKIELFEDFRFNPDQVPGDIRNIKRPIIGYVGGIHRQIDFALINFIAQDHPEWSIVLIGPEQTDVLQINNLENVFLLGMKDFPSLPSYINEFDVAIIPYKINAYTATVFPTKLNEYHALGKAVVSTDLPEITNFNAENNNLVLVGKTYREFSDCISKMLNDKNDQSINQRLASARRNSWSARIEEMGNLLEETIERKSTSPANWQERFLKFYAATQRKMVKIGAIVLAAYLLLFHTPVVWFVAAPLKIAQMPEKADCIVVFAGGVGESGQAGQGYEERVEHAVNLYKAGFADKLIFSSGYAYRFKEVEVMKALAESLGVRGRQIILEAEAKNTKENVIFSADIVRNSGERSILLVGSPYHMRRASLVFRKLAKEIKVYYTPIPNSLFYKHKKWGGARLRQARAILHEYLSIVYYWWKGYI
jgi:uncharacterized SAM-binding protein YcdF (DUF218 family)